MTTPHEFKIGDWVTTPWLSPNCGQIVGGPLIYACEKAWTVQWPSRVSSALDIVRESVLTCVPEEQAKRQNEEQERLIRENLLRDRTGP